MSTTLKVILLALAACAVPALCYWYWELCDAIRKFEEMDK